MIRNFAHCAKLIAIPHQLQQREWTEWKIKCGIPYQRNSINILPLSRRTLHNQHKLAILGIKVGEYLKKDFLSREAVSPHHLLCRIFKKLAAWDRKQTTFNSRMSGYYRSLYAVCILQAWRLFPSNAVFLNSYDMFYAEVKKIGKPTR